MLARVAGGDAQWVEPLAHVVVVRRIVQDDVTDDGAAGLPVDYEDGIDGRVGHGDVPLGDGVDAPGAVAGYRTGEAGEEDDEEGGGEEEGEGWPPHDDDHEGWG